MRLLVIASLLVAPTLAHADPAPPTDAKQMHTDDCARARKQHRTCVIDMGKSEDITGNAPKAGGVAIGLIGFGTAASLIRIRRDFIVEIIKSAEDL